MPTRRTLRRAALAAGALTVLIATSLASPLVDRVDINDLIARLATDIRDNYVFPDKGAQAADMLEANAKAGDYDNLDEQALAQRLTADLRTLTRDLHFGVRLEPPEPPALVESRPPAPARETAIRRVDRLEGNIGYIDLRGFGPRAAVESRIHATMHLLEGADAIILDLRKNGGGEPETVQLLCSYLFPKDKPVHLNSLYFRPTDETTEYWTQPGSVQGPGFADTPVWVLTSRFTFSAAEECTYNLKARKRATIVGETTGGGAHPVDAFRVGNFVAMIPVGRAIHPVTGTNWEGTGVEPDVKAPADQALDVAIDLAMENLAASEDPDVADEARWALLTRRAQSRPFDIDPARLAAIAGDYGERHITQREGTLWYARAAVTAEPRRLVPVAEETFVIDGTPGFRLENHRAPDGSIKGLRGVYQQGHSDYSPRQN
jgi:hypothetical protein